MQLAPDLDTGLAQLGCGSVCEGCAAKPLALLQRREKQAAARHPVGRVWPFSRRRPVRLTACGRLVGGEQPGGLQSSQQHEATGERTASANTALRKGGEWAFKIQASLTAHWHDKGADWRGLAHTQAHHRSRLSDSVKNGNALRTMHNAALPAR